MAKTISTQIVIHASPEKIWSVLTDFQAYPSWNPFIKSISGTPMEGKKITARLEPPGQKGMTFHPRVLEFEANKKFRWLGHFGIPGLFDGEHSFELLSNADGTTTFHQSEKFHGILVPLLKKMLDVNTLDGFRQMNEALKKRTEALDKF